MIGTYRHIMTYDQIDMSERLGYVGVYGKPSSKGFYNGVYLENIYCIIYIYKWGYNDVSS